MRRRIALGEPGRAAGTTLARGEAWSVDDVVCTLGPEDRPFEERHSGVSIGVVVAGTFQYRSASGHEMLTPGSLLLGNEGQCFECGHEHAAGDRCVAFRFAAEYFERIAADVGARRTSQVFRAGRLPPLRKISRVSAGAAAGVLGAADTAWDELALELAAEALRLANGLPDRATPVPRGAEARATESARVIERAPAARLTLQRLAAEAGLSPFHYLRTFDDDVQKHRDRVYGHGVLRLVVEPVGRWRWGRRPGYI